MSNVRLLIIDDEPDFGAYVERVAKDCGFEAIAVTDADVFRAHVVSWSPNVIMTDLQMPRVDGIELLRELAQNNIRAKILLASGVDTRVLDTAKQLGINAGLEIVGTLLKPVRLAELRRMLDTVKGQTSPITPVEVERAVERNELALHYQPRLDARIGKITGSEALVRWWHPSKGLLMPGQFLTITESSTVIDRLTDWVIEAALKQNSEWRAAGLELDLSLNISARNLNDLELPDRIARLCTVYKIPPHSITIELTETATMKDASKIMDNLTRMRLKGFGLAIDDFGTGYSSLVQLRRLPFTELKIDKSFVMDMGTSKDSAVIVKTMIDMAYNLGLVPVAEGVETEGAYEQLVARSCYLLQGYWISRPLPADKFREMVSSYTLPAGVQRPGMTAPEAEKKPTAPEGQQPSIPQPC